MAQQLGNGQWQCVCGFNNRATNEVCGGNGPMGCKAPRTDSLAAEDVRGIVAEETFLTADSQWTCMCGFKNRATNDVCGGNGPMGCKTPREVGAVGETVVTQPPQVMRPSTLGYKPGVARATPAISTVGYKPAGSLSPSRPSGGLASDGSWACASCGFTNKPTNEMCGGTGNLGCKQPRPGSSKGKGKGLMTKGAALQQLAAWSYAPAMFTPLPLAAAAYAPTSDWSCPSCGFTNKATNEVCGGRGPLGCKQPYQAVKPVRNPYLAAGKKRSFEQLAGDQWLCSCGFMNKASNTVCGGAGGSLGCKAPREESEGPVRKARRTSVDVEGLPKWVCECGFMNNGKNTQCGGTGPMGCNAPRPEEADVFAAEDPM